MSKHYLTRRTIHTSMTIFMAVLALGSMQHTYAAHDIRDPLTIDTTPIQKATFSPLRTINSLADAPVLQQTVTQVQPKAAPVITQPTGTCSDWMRAAGITDIADATRLLQWESNCNPYAINASSGACGLAQELPCGKSGCSLGDGACEMKWFNQYVISRYGSMYAAVQFHLVMGWY